jgi:electron transfer flavoprotein beta subunit
VDGKKVRVKRLLDDRFEVVETRMPALLTVVKQANEPRHAGLRGVMRARKAEIPTLKADDIGADVPRCGLNGSPTNVVRVFSPTRHGSGERLEGEPAEVAAQLFEKLRAGQIV